MLVCDDDCHEIVTVAQRCRKLTLRCNKLLGASVGQINVGPVTVFVHHRTSTARLNRNLIPPADETMSWTKRGWLCLLAAGAQPIDKSWGIVSSKSDTSKHTFRNMALKKVKRYF